MFVFPHPREEALCDQVKTICSFGKRKFLPFMTVNEGARQDGSKSHQSDAKSGAAAKASWVDWVMLINMTGPILLFVA